MVVGKNSKDAELSVDVDLIGLLRNMQAPEIDFDAERMAELMDEFEYHEKIDYYAGCYRLHKKFSPAKMDLKSTNDVFAKIKGLEINRISAPQCCYNPKGLQHMIDGIQTRTMVHICLGCHGQATSNLPEGSETKVMLLPEFVEMAMNQ